MPRPTVPTLFCVLAFTLIPVAAHAQSPEKFGPPLETVKTFNNFPLVGVAVSREGRIFASAPAASTGNKVIEVNAKSGEITPYPDQNWNMPTTENQHRWVVPQALWIDKADHLWVLDSGQAVLAAVQQGARPKLVEFDLSTNKMIRSYGFEGVVAPPDSLNDVRIDLVHGYAYLTNIGKKGSLVVLNLRTGKSRQVLVGDRSTFADPHQYLMLGDQPAEGANGKPVAIQADGIALSPDADWLYYRPLTDHNYWRVPTSALTDASLSEAALSQRVEYLGDGVMSGGLIMDKHGRLYGGNLEHSSVAIMTIDSATHELSTRLFVRDLGKLSWADGFSIHDGYLYIADSHLWEIAFKNHLPRSGPFTIFRVKLPN